MVLFVVGGGVGDGVVSGGDGDGVDGVVAGVAKLLVAGLSWCC